MIIITDKKFLKNKKITNEKGLEIFNTLYEIIKVENQEVIDKVNDALKRHTMVINEEIDQLYSYLGVEDQWDSDSNQMILVKKSNKSKK